MVHSEICDVRGYEKLHTAIEKQAKEEMTEWLIQRVIFLEGMPIVQKLTQLRLAKQWSI